MPKAATLAMVAAGAVLGGLIALSSSSGPAPLKTEGLSTATTAPKSSVNLSNNSLAPIVDEPSSSVLGNNFSKPIVTPNSVIAAAILPGSTTALSTATTAAPGAPLKSTSAKPGSTVGPAPADNRNPSGAVFAINSGQGSGFGSGQTNSAQPSGSPATGTTTTTSGGGQANGTTTTTEAPQQTTTTAAPQTTTTARPTTTTQAPATTTTAAPTTTTTAPPPTTTTTKPESQQCKDARTQLAKDQATLDKHKAEGASASTLKKDQERVDRDQQAVDEKCGA